MKKRIFSVLLGVLLLIVAVTFAVQADVSWLDAAAIQKAAEEIDFAAGTVHVCPACGGEAKNWIPLSVSYGIRPTPGNHYYLAGDVTFKGSADAILITPQNGTICLHLNGNDLTATGSSRALFADKGTINVMGSGTVSGNFSYGSTLYVRDGGMMNLYGGRYVGASGNENPVLRQNVGTVNVYADATIEAGTSEQSGVYMGSGASFNLLGGQVKKIYMTAGSYYQKDGAVSQHFAVTAAGASVTLSGSPQISGDGLILLAGKTVTLDALEKTASVVISGAGTFTGTGMADYADCFTAAGEGDVIVAEDSLKYIPATVTSGYCPACSKSVTWKSMSGNSAVTLTDGDHYYLTDDVTYTASSGEAFITAPTSGKACIHLNGKNLTATQNRVVNGALGSLNIMGAGTVSGNKNAVGATLRPCSGGKLFLYGGTYTRAAGNTQAVMYTQSSVVSVYGSTFTAPEGASALIYQESDTSTLHLYSGRITGGNNTDGYGGNLRLVKGRFYMYGGAITGGAATAGGDDVYIAGGEFHMTGGTIDGEVLVKDAAPSVSLSGKPVITGKGLVLPAGKVLNLDTFAEGASVAVKANGVFTAAGTADYAVYFKAAEQTDFIQVQDGALHYFNNGVLTTGTASVTAWCPACRTEAPWSPLSGNGTKYLSNGHYFLTSDIATSSSDGVLKTSSANTGSSCVHLNGHNIIKTDGNRAVYVTLGTLNILGNGTVQANYQNQYGCTVYMNAAANLNLYGGTYKKAAGNPYPIIRTTNGELNMYGGATVDGENIESSYAAVYIGKTFNMYGGTIQNGNNPSSTGGNIYASGTLYLNGGTVTDGMAKDGGNIYIYSGTTTVAGATIQKGTASNQGGNIKLDGGKLSITGGTLSGGDAASGGSICVNGYSATMSGGTITGGIAKDNGGNVYVTGGGNVNIAGGTVINGISTSGHGGNLFVYKGQLAVGADVTVTKGRAKVYGGNIYVSGKSGEAAVLNLYGTVTDGKAGNGGNIGADGANATINLFPGSIVSRGEGTYTAAESDDSWIVGNVLVKGGSLKMSGGEIRNGISAMASKNIMLTNAEMEMSGGVIYGDKNAANYTVGSAIRSHGSNSTVTLSGNAKVIREDGECTSLIRCYENKLVIAAGWSGQASVTWNGTAPEYNYGDTILATRCENTGAFTGTLVYDERGDKPCIFGGENGTMVIADKKLVNGDTVTWPKDIVAAHAAAEDSCIVLMADAALEIQEGSSATVDLAGFDLTVTGTGTVYGMNSANFVNGAYIADAQGTLTTESATVAPIADSVAGKYIAITDGKTSTFHRLDMDITELTLNTNRAALYYVAKFGCDDTLAAKISDFGISYSVVNMPSAGDTDSVHVSMWEAAGNQFTTEARTCFISNIFAEGKDNAVRGKMPIYANPYVVLDGQTIMADATTEDKVEDENFDGVAKSLYDVLRYFDQPAIYNALTEERKTYLNSFYTNWYTDIQDWDLKLITKEYDSSNLQFAEGTQNATCAVCGQTVAWTAITADAPVQMEAGKHYYLAESVTYTGADETGFITTPASGVACLHLNGCDLTATATRAIYVSGGTLNVLGKGQVSGNASASGGATLFVRDGGTLNLYGGTYVKAAENTTRPILDLYRGTVNMYRITTIDGAGQASATAPGCVLLEADTAVFNLYGGVIQNGNGKGNAGNVRLGSGSSFNMYGGSVLNGVTGGNGGNFYIENGKLNISGGVVTGGEVYVKDANGKVALSGAPQIDYLTLPEGIMATLGELSAGASVKVNANGAFTTYHEKAADYAKYFSTMTSAARVEVRDGVLHCTKMYLNDLEFIEGTQQALCPACDKVVTWTAVSADAPSEDGGGAYEMKDGDHYYLAEDINNTGAGWSSFIWAPPSYGMVGCFHLNGHNLTVTHGRAIQGSAGQLNVMGQGTVIGDYDYTTNTAQGSTINIDTGGTKGIINLYGGTYLKANDNSHTAVASVWSAGGVINVYEGAHIQGVAGQYSIYTETPRNVKSTVGIYGGKISGGSIYISSSNAEKALESRLIVDGGDINVDVEMAANTKATLSGSPVIKKLTLAAGVKLEVDGLKQDASINLSASGVFTEETAQAEAIKNCFEPTNKNYDIVVKGNTLYCQKNYASSLTGSQDNCLVCETAVTWTAVTGAMTLADGGHYYLTGDVDATVTAPASGTACLHLNGYDLTKIAGSAGTLNVLGSGQTSATVDNAAGTLNLYSGSYGQITAGANGGYLNIYDDAVVTGNVTANENTAVLIYNSKVQGVLDLGDGTLSMYNGTVEKLVADKDATIVLDGAPVVGRMELAPLTKLTVENLIDGTDITVLAHHVFSRQHAVMESFAKFFHPANDVGAITVVDNTLYYESTYTAACGSSCPVCEETVIWTTLSGDAAIALQAGGHYYLTSDVTYSGSDAFLTAPASGTACIHLNGHTMTAQKAIAGNAGNLNILGSGTVAGTVDQAAAGTINLYAGNYTGTVTATAGSVNVYDEATVQAAVTATNAAVNVYGGKLDGNAAITDGSFILTDGSVTGTVTASGSPQIILSGKAVISKLDLAKGILMDLRYMRADSSISISADGAFTAEFENAAAYNDYFTTSDEGYWIVVRDGGLYQKALVNGVASSNDKTVLESMYTGRTAKQGQFHEHAATGGTSDGNSTLAEWKQILIDKDMDFTTIVDHKQSLHMKLEDWDNDLFIGGSEPSASMRDKVHLEKRALHYNMIFSNPEGLEAVVSKFTEYGWDGEHFGYPSFTTERFGLVIDEVLAQGGFFVHVHPKYPSYLVSDDPLDYWFRDYTGLEIVTGDGGDIRREENNAAYKLWLDLLDLDKRVYATFGSDSHKLSDTHSLMTFYAGTPADGQTMADVYVNLARAGDMTAGSVGIRMSLDNTVSMGGHTDFAQAERLIFSVGDYHSIDIHEDHTYRVDLYDDSGVIFSQILSGGETEYFAIDVSEDVRFYRAEVFDVTEGYLIAIGNPIWND